MAPATAERPRKRLRADAEAVDASAAAARARAADAGADALASPATVLALSALLDAARPSAAAREAARPALRALRDALVAFAEGGAVVCGDGKAVAKELARAAGRVEFRGDPADVKFETGAPEAVDVVGGYMLGLGVAPLEVDVAVQMPRGMFQSKDFRNYRYHDKRLLFLAQVARLLRKGYSHVFTDVVLGASCLAGDSAKPLLTLRPVDAQSVTIRIIPTLAADVFDASKLESSRGNVRPSGMSSVAAVPTPGYNASVIVDTLPRRHLATLHARTVAAPAFVDAALMLRLWAHRRRLPDSGFAAAALLAHTLASGAAPARAGKEHLFRAAVARVRAGAMASLTVDGVCVASVAAWSPALLSRWRKEAAAALEVLDAPGASNDAWGGVIPALFSTARGSISRPVPLCTLFDAYVKFEGPDGERKENGRSGRLGGLPEQAEMLKTLETALIDTRRVESVEGIETGVFGLVLPPTGDGGEMPAYRKVDVRPDDVDASSFKSFWGSKAEVRRFRDGTIVDSLVWTGGLGVIDEIVKYACARHLRGTVVATTVLAQVEEAAGLLGIDTGASKAIAVFNELSGFLRKAKGLPLVIATVQAVSPYLRRSAVQPVRPNPSGKFIEPLDILAVFEKSGAWPDDPLAMASAKAGFYLALKTGLAELGIASRPTVSFVDILLGGFVFRLRVRVDKEKLMTGLEKDARQRLVWETESRIFLHDAMRNIPSAILGDTARLLKRWLSSHVLFCEFGERKDELVELVAARIVSVQRSIGARSVFSGFFQSLHLLAEFPWEAAPLVVPLSASADDYDLGDADAGVSSKRERKECEELYESAIDAYNRSQHVEGSCIYLATNYDPSGSWFSSANHGPERVILKRACAAAVAALGFMDKILSSSTQSAAGSKWSALFRSPGNSFGLTIALNRSWVPRSTRALTKGEFYMAKPVSRLDTAIVGLDPVEHLVKLLKFRLGAHAMFLYDLYGGSRVYVVWRPAADTEIPFTLQTLSFMTPCAETNRLRPNKGEMLQVMRCIGGDVIYSIKEN